MAVFPADLCQLRADRTIADVTDLIVQGLSVDLALGSPGDCHDPCLALSRFLAHGRRSSLVP
jgi:hypothetical protein